MTVLNDLASFSLALAGLVFSGLQFKTAEANRRAAYHKHYEEIYAALNAAYNILYNCPEEPRGVYSEFHLSRWLKDGTKLDLTERHEFRPFCTEFYKYKKELFERLEKAYGTLDTIRLKALLYLPKPLADDFLDVLSEVSCLWKYGENYPFTCQEYLIRETQRFDYYWEHKQNDIKEFSYFAGGFCDDYHSVIKQLAPFLWADKLSPYLADSAISDEPYLQKIDEQAGEEIKKMALYFWHGVKKYWLASPLLYLLYIFLIKK